MSKKFNLNKPINRNNNAIRQHNNKIEYNTTQETENNDEIGNEIENNQPQQIEFKNNLELSPKDDIELKVPVKVKISLVIIFVVGCLLLMMLFIVINAPNFVSSSGIKNGYAYKYYSGTCSKVKYGDDIIDFEDYITAVVAGEVTSRSDETLKAFAVAARTYLLHKTEQNKVNTSDNECYYDATDISQAYHPEKVNDRHKNAVKETEGLIITINGNVAGGHFDEACVYNAGQASAADPSNNYSDDNYYIQYGREDVGGINFQEIPKTDLDKFRNNIEYYANTGSPCYNNHGMGMSQSGSEYLSVIKNYTWKEIIDFYYKGEEEIMTIIEVYGSFGDGTIYRQGDPAWGNIPLGNSSTNMAQSGCAVTSIAIGINFSGTNLTVQSFDAGVFIDALNNGNCFTESGGIKWACSTISRIAPSVKYVSSNSIGGDNPSKINFINSYPLNKYIIITHFKNSNHARGHYVNFQEFTNNDEYIARDPSPGNITTQKISEIDQVVIYSY